MKYSIPLFGVLLITLGCSQHVRSRPINLGEKELPVPKKKDFLDHAVLLAKDFKENHKRKIVPLSSSSQKYIKGLSRKIKAGNDLLLKGVHNSVFIINHNKSFHFSFPNGDIFLSTKLLKKHIQHEGLLASVLAIEMIKSCRHIFIKRFLTPTGVLSVDDVAPFVKTDLNLRNQINKWTIYTLKKSGLNPLSLLQLLQIKNKNFSDFFQTLEEGRVASLEEVEIKNFLIEKKFFKDLGDFSKNSSSAFYTFMKEIKQS